MQSQRNPQGSDSGRNNGRPADTKHTQNPTGRQTPTPTDIPIRMFSEETERSYGKQHSGGYHVTDSISSVAVIFLVVLICVSATILALKSVNWDNIFSDHTRQPFDKTISILYGPYITSEQRDHYLTNYIPMSAEDVYRGHCILVNPDHVYHFPEEENVVSVYKNKTLSYLVNNGTETLALDAVHAMNDMMDAFYEETGKDSVVITSGYRSKEEQEEVYDYYEQLYGSDYAEAYVQIPGYSEHHTGYAMDLAVYEIYDEDNSAMWKFDGTGDYYWVFKNCAQYGFILRYSASKEDITGIDYESWHFRYVGIANALAITNIGAALEEYVELIKTYSYDGTRYTITADNGDTYQIYYVPYSGGDTQLIPIPTTALDYEISGNNTDGFIVSVRVPQMS